MGGFRLRRLDHSGSVRVDATREFSYSPASSVGISRANTGPDDTGRSLQPSPLVPFARLLAVLHCECVCLVALRFRGNMLAVSRFIVGVNVLRFVKDAVFPSVLIALPGHTTEPPHFVAAGIAAVIGHALFYPFDLLRCVCSCVCVRHTRFPYSPLPSQDSHCRDVSAWRGPECPFIST